MRLIILPLSQSPQTLCWIFLLFKQFIKYLHCLLIGYDTFSVKLIFPIFEPDNILKCARCLNSFFLFTTTD